MKHFLLFLPFLALTAFGQKNDPVLMTVNGEAVTRSEFEYAYNKNRGGDNVTLSAKDYAQMYLDFRLKVADAKMQKLDTVAALREEFTKYRDALLTQYLVDETFLDSVARSIYDRTKAQIGGKDLFRASHILIRVKQKDSEATIKQAFLKADSIYQLLKGGADFATLAKKFSQDPNSAKDGGELPWLMPGQTLAEFEEQAYKLQAGEMSAPFLSTVGYHIVKMNERKPFEDYETLKPEIIEAIKQQGAEEEAAERGIRKAMAASGGKLTREEVLDSTLRAHENNPEVKYLVKEYADGVLLYAVSQKKIWEPAHKDTKGLESTFSKNKKKYAWSEPHFKGFLYSAKDKRTAKAVKKFMKRHAQDENWRQSVKLEFNKDSDKVVVTGPWLTVRGKNAHIDYYAFKQGTPAPVAGYPHTGIVGKVIRQPQTYNDVLSEVMGDYQKELEEAWRKELRAKYPYSIDESVLSTVNQH